MLRTILSTLIFAFLVMAACARSLPERFPRTSPVAASATAGDAPSVTRALSTDPPLPGEPLDGWRGLGETPDAPAHHHHHGHGAAEEAP